MVHDTSPFSIPWLNLYDKNILTIISDDCKWTLYYKIIMMIVSALPLALESVINY